MAVEVKIHGRLYKDSKTEVDLVYKNLLMSAKTAVVYFLLVCMIPNMRVGWQIRKILLKLTITNQ